MPFSNDLILEYNNSKSELSTSNVDLLICDDVDLYGLLS